MIIRKLSTDFLPLPIYPITACAYHHQERVNRPHGLRGVAQLLFVLEGEGELLCQGEHHALRPGCAFFLDQDTPHCYGGKRGLVTAWVTFGGTGLDEIRRCIGQRSFLLIENVNVASASVIIKRLEQEYYERRREGMLSSYAYRLLMDFVDGLEEQREEDMEPVIRYMEEHFDKRITVDQLASICHTSRSTFCQRFKATFGCTAFEKLMEIRLLNAELYLILYPDDMIGGIAKQCGFDDVGYFCKSFKKRFGATPSDYRLRSRAPTEPDMEGHI